MASNVSNVSTVLNSTTPMVSTTSMAFTTSNMSMAMVSTTSMAFNTSNMIMASSNSTTSFLSAAVAMVSTTPMAFTTSNMTMASSNSTTSFPSAAESQALVLGVLVLIISFKGHVVLRLSRYRPTILYAAFTSVLGPEKFFIAPLLQWACLFLLAAPILLLVLAAQSAAVEHQRVAALCGTLVAVLICAAWGIGRFHSDAFALRSRAGSAACLAALLALAAFFLLFIYVVPPFSFVGTSITFLCLSAVPGILMAFRAAPYRSSQQFLDDLTVLKDGSSPGGSVAEASSSSSGHLAVLLRFGVSLVILFVYSVTVLVRSEEEDVRGVGFVVAGAVAVLDVAVWYSQKIGLIAGSIEVSLVAVLARVAACSWGEHWWLLGHSCVYLALGVFLVGRAVDAWIPKPNGTIVRRQQLAANLLAELQKKTSESESASKTDAAADGSAAAPEPTADSKMTSSQQSGMKRLLACITLSFCLELGLLSVESVAPLLHGNKVSLCGTCKAQGQQLYGIIAVFAVFGVGLGLAAIRHAEVKKKPDDTPILKQFWRPLVAVYIYWLGVAAFTSFVVDSWSVLVSAGYVPGIAILFQQAHKQWLADDFKFVSPSDEGSTGKVTPADAADLEPGLASAIANNGIVQKWQSYPWVARTWLICFLTTLAYAVTLHLTMDPVNRWIGWTIAMALVVVGCTILSNHTWFGTFRFDRFQYCMVAIVCISLFAWGFGVWTIHNRSVVDYFALGILLVLILYPGGYSGFLALQMMKDADWAPKDPLTLKFIRVATVISGVLYLVFLVILILLGFAGEAIVGLCLAFVATLGAVLAKRRKENRNWLPQKVKSLSKICVGVLIILGSIGMALSRQSIFAGFSVFCGGLVLVFGVVGINDVLKQREKPRASQLRIFSDHVFPVYRVGTSDVLEDGQKDILCALGACASTAVWGLSAAATLEHLAYVGMEIAVLACMVAFILVCHCIQTGGRQRADLICDPKRIQEALLGVLDNECVKKDTSDDSDPGKTAAASAFLDLFGEKLLTASGEVSTADALSGKDAVAIYFSAHWCGPCRGFTPQLAQWYSSDLKAKGLEVVFASSDQDDSGFQEYFKEMPWLALPYSDRAKKDALSQKFNVTGIPKLIILDADGKVITENGRQTVSQDPTGKDFPWKPKTGTDTGSQKKKVTADANESKVFERLDAELKRFSNELSGAQEQLEVAFPLANQGAYHMIPFISFFHVCNAAVAKVKKDPNGQGCVPNKSPSDPHKAHADVLDRVCAIQESAVRRHRFAAKVQISVVNILAHERWQKESELRAFIASLDLGIEGVTADDFDALPRNVKAQVEDAWGAWKEAQRKRLALEEQRRREEEERARQRRERERQAREAACKKIDEAVATGDVESIEAALKEAANVGLSDAVEAVSKGKLKLKQLKEVIEELQSASKAMDLTALNAALVKAGVIGLKGKALQDAQAAYSRLEQQEHDKRRKVEELSRALQAAKMSRNIAELQAALDACESSGLPIEGVAEAKDLLQQLKNARDALKEATISKDMGLIEKALATANKLTLADDAVELARKVLDELRQEELERLRKEEEAKERDKQEEAKEREKQAARNALQSAIRSRSIESLQHALQNARGVGLADWEKKDAAALLEKLEEVRKELQQALTGENLKALETALRNAKHMQLKDVALLQEAEAKIRKLKEKGDEEDELRRRMQEEAERRRKEHEEEDLRRKMKEEEERRRKEEEERRRKETEDQLTGDGKVIAIDVDDLKRSIPAGGKYEDKSFSFNKAVSADKRTACKWTRAIELVPDASIYVNSCEASDIHQGCLGDCWYLSALACCAAQPGQIEKVFNKASEPQLGLYVTRFYKNGVWRDIAVDDYLPTKYNKPYFAKSGQKNEVWVQILEKAYAKLHGSYEAIEAGHVSDGLVDLTGGVGGVVSTKGPTASTEIADGSLWAKIKGYADAGHLLGAGSCAGVDTDTSDKGIVQGHAYSILQVVEVDSHKLLQCRNPWGQVEWKGKWSDYDKKSWTQRMVAKVGYKDGGDDGTFWIAFEDFVVQYDDVYICRLFGAGWHSTSLASEWKGKTAGGCQNYGSFKDNPVFRLQVNRRMQLIIVLTQADTRGTGSDLHCIGASLYQALSNGGRAGNRFASSGTFSNTRSKVIEQEIAPGQHGAHFLIASTFSPAEENAFAVSVYWQGGKDDVKLTQRV